MKKVAVIHYDEIALKGKNRPFFERVLVDNIKNKLGKEFIIKNSWGRIFVYGDNYKSVTNKLFLIPGIATFGIGFEIAKEDCQISKIANVAIELAQESEFDTFRITARRVDKNFGKTSNEIERMVGEIVFLHFSRNKNVNLKKPDIEIVVEILHDKIVIYVKQRGISGLPVGSSGKAVALLSGGFDSPVATYKLITRGVQPVFAHFHGLPKTSPQSVEKVRELSELLARYTNKAELVLVPSLPIMRAITRSAKDKLRVILLRRMMMRVVCELAKERGAKAIITGESVGQVASQTLENLGAIAASSELPVLRPLCGFNKNAILEIARNIGTYDISARPHDDTCSMFVPKNPETKANMEEVLEAEGDYNVNELTENAILNSEFITIKV